MKGKRHFTKQKIDEIRKLLAEKVRSPQTRQKGLRQKLRNMDFHIRDFTESTGGFGPADLDRLIKAGTIIVIGAKPSGATRTADQPPKSAKESVDTNDTHVLPDVLSVGLKLVVCGTAVGRRSAEVSAYYAGRGNQFWRVLHQTGLTPRQLKPQDFRSLPAFGIGLTDLVKGASGSDADLSDDDYGVRAFEQKILRYAPKLLCFNGKQAAKVYLDTASVKYGLHDCRIGATRVFVAPSTSGAARGSWDEALWREVARLCLTD